MISIIAISAVMVFAMMVLMFILIGIYASRYKRVRPGTAMIIYGKMDQRGKDIIIVTKGGRFIWPVFQSYMSLPIDLRYSEYRISNIYPRSMKQDQILDSFIKISYQMGPDEKMIRKAAANLLNLSEGQVEEVMRSSVEKHIRHEAGKIGLESLLNDPLFLEEKTRSGVSRDLSELGISVKSLSVAVISRM